MEGIWNNRKYPRPIDSGVFPVQRKLEDFEGEVEVDRSSRAYVRWVQQSLNQVMGSGLVPDGILGTRTRRALRSFQSRSGLGNSGRVGPQTEHALIAAGANPPPRTTTAAGPSTAPPGIPALARPKDSNPPAYSIYPIIPLHNDLGSAQPMTGIFIPENYCPQSSVDLIVYLHGYKRRAHLPTYSVDKYWSLSQFRLREAVNQSQKNVILVAPTLGTKNEPGHLVSGAGFDRFIEQVMAALRQYGPYAGSSSTPAVGNIILACHSGSGGVMRAIAFGKSRYAAQFRECWAFEPSSAGDPDVWASWTGSNRKYYIYYLPGSAGDAFNQHLNAGYRQNIGTFKTTVSHDATPSYYLADRIKAAQSLVDKRSCIPAYSPQQEWGESEYTSFGAEDDGTGMLLAENGPPAIPVSRQPLPVPPQDPVPFAPPPNMGSYWPVRTRRKEGRRVSYRASDGTTQGYPGRMFLANRETKRDNKAVQRWHVGVDLFAYVGDEIVACEDGIIVAFNYFYKAKSGQSTYRLLIEHSNVVVNYGEVTSDSLTRHGLKKGMSVRAGQPIAFVSDTSMLHFETYTKGTTSSHRWWKHERQPPAELLNPTRYLLFLQQYGLGAGQTSQPSSAPAPSSGSMTEALRRGLYQSVIQQSIRQGIRDENRLTDMVFHARHPELGGRRLQRHERQLVREWLDIRNRLVRPELANSSNASASSVSARTTTSTSVARPGAKVSDRLVQETLAMAARTVPGLGINLEQLLQRHLSEAGGIPMEVLLAFIRKEAGGKLFNDATAGKWSEKYQKYSPEFYELGVFQTPAGDHGCTGAPGMKRCNHEPPGLNVKGSSFGKGWHRLMGTYPTASNWKDPTMQVRIGLWNLTSTGERIAREFPDLFPSSGSEWYLQMAVLYSFSKGAGWTRAFLRKYRNELGALPESQRWNFLHGKEADFKGLKGAWTKTFDPENVDEKMALATKLRAVRGATSY